MGVQNYVTPTGKLVVTGEPRRIREKNLGTVANGYPGRLVVREDTDFDIKVSDGVLPPIGFLGYPGEFEGTDLQYTVGDITTINVVDSVLPVYSGGGYTIYIPSGLAPGFTVAEGDTLLSWANGQVAAGVEIGGKFAIKIPFAQGEGEVDTGIDLPAGVLVTDAIVNVTTLNASGTIDVGILSTESGGDADGFLDGVSCAALGMTVNTVSNATDGSNTLGVLISDTLTTADGTALFYRSPVKYKTNGTARSITYTTSAHAIAGFIYLFVESPGIKPVGIAGAAAAATTSAAANVFVEATL